MNYKIIYKSYENEFSEFGDTVNGVGWPRESDVSVRYKVMTEQFVPVDNVITVLDFGCGLSHYYDYLIRTGYEEKINYIGLDISNTYIEASKLKYPNNKYICLDVIENEIYDDFDYAVINGVFTQKFTLTNDEMFEFLKNVVKKLYASCVRGIAFNVMSNNVDYKKEGAFHLSMDVLSKFLVEDVTKNFVIRHDYGLYEYTVYLKK